MTDRARLLPATEGWPGRAMAECRATYDFCGAGLILEAEEAAIADMFARGFGSFLCDGSRTFSEQPFLLRIRKGEQSIATDLPLVWSGAFPEGGSGRLFEDAERCLLEVTGSCRVDIEPGSRRAVVSLADGGMRRFMGSASMLVLDLTLLAGGQHLVHGASLLRPATGGAILVCGPSGRGKTTTSIALARGGFGLMTDDASVLTLDGGRVRVWGMPRALKVHRRTAALMPWLQPFIGEWDINDEQGVPLRDIAGDVRVAPPSPQPLEAVVLLGDRSPAGHRLDRLSKSEALIEIAADNVAWFEGGAPRRSVMLFEALGEAIAAAPTYRLNAGPDLDALPSFIARSLEEAPPLRAAP
jgi:hypothetical protein